MRRLIFALATVSSFLGTNVQAQTVVELYTSQGCSSCPPADAMLAELSKRSDVIALALHVDYWDYLGWKDDLAHPAFTHRQRNYAEAAGTDTIYTPQMIIDGVAHVVGSRPVQVMNHLMARQKQTNSVTVDLRRAGDRIEVGATATRPLPRDAVIQLVRFIPLETRDIRRGENAGKRIDYVNVVTSWQIAKRWNTLEPLKFSTDVKGSDGVAVIVQVGTDGPILGAAQLR